MDSPVAVFSAVVGYLCGSISFARLVSRIFAPREDITGTEIDVKGSEQKLIMKSVSATTVSIHIGPKLGFLTVILDMLKVAVPTLVFKRLFPGAPYFLITAITGMVGHIWPLYHGFKGGRGFSAVYGGMFAIDWVGVFATSLGGMVFGLFVVRDFLVAYMAGIWFLILWLWLRTHDVGHLLYAIAVNVILMLAMIGEMKQYVKFRREGKGGELSEVMQLTGMGRGIYRMGKRFGLIEGKPRSENDG